MRWFLRSKIHLATVTESVVEYVGSIGIDEDLMGRAGILPGEKVLVADTANGVRLETYVIVEERGSGAITMNGAAAKLIDPGDRIIIMGFELADRLAKPKIVAVDEQNRFTEYL